MNGAGSLRVLLGGDTRKASQIQLDCYVKNKLLLCKATIIGGLFVITISVNYLYMSNWLKLGYQI